MSQKGNIVYFHIPQDLKTTTADLEAIGVGDFNPRNASKTALRKAVAIVTKNLWRASGKVLKAEKKKTEDTSSETSYSIVYPHVENKEYAGKTVLTVTLNKTDDSLEYIRGRQQDGSPWLDDVTNADLVRQISSLFTAETETVDHEQFRQVATRYLKGECLAISMRPDSGGVYYVDGEFTTQLTKLKRVFQEFASRSRLPLRLDMVPVYDDEGTNEAISWAAVSEFEREIQRFQGDLKGISNAGSTKRILKGRVKEGQRIMERLAAHRKHMTDRFEEFSSTMERIETGLKAIVEETHGKAVEAFDFSEALFGISEEIEAAPDTAESLAEQARQMSENITDRA
jgi:hypothetical protein